MIKGVGMERVTLQYIFFYVSTELHDFLSGENRETREKLELKVLLELSSCSENHKDGPDFLLIS